jgi:hypothetical protein
MIYVYKENRNGKLYSIDMYEDYIRYFIAALIYWKVQFIFETGVSPSKWTIGNIKTVYKNKGGGCDPRNFRSIFLMSCLDKLFASFLNDRLNNHSNKVNFRKSNWFSQYFFQHRTIYFLHICFSKVKKKTNGIYFGLSKHSIQIGVLVYGMK